MQPPGRISLFFVAAGSSPAGLFSVSRSVFCQSVCVAASRPAFSPAGLPFLQRPAFSVGWPAFVDRPVLLPAATISAAGLYSFSAGSLPSAALLCCRGVCFGAGFAGPVFDPFRFPPGLCRRTLCFVPGCLFWRRARRSRLWPIPVPAGPLFCRAVRLSVAAIQLPFQLARGHGLGDQGIASGLFGRRRSVSKA